MKSSAVRVSTEKGAEEDPKETSQPFLGVQSEGGPSGLEGRAHVGGTGRAFRCSSQSDPGLEEAAY